MRVYLLSSGLVATVLLAAAPATAFVTTFGSSLASSCYRSSLSNYGTLAAVKACTRALDEEPLYPRDRIATMVNRGIVRMNLGDYQLAEADFDEAIAMDAGYPESYLNKGFLRLRQDRTTEAIALIDEALEKQTGWSALAFFARAVADERLGNVRAAYSDFQKARELAPRWSLPAKELARFKIK